jgi:hypothetical protein
LDQNLTESILDYLHEGAGEIGASKSRLDGINARLRVLERLVLEGNSKAAIVVEIALLRDAVETLRKASTAVVVVASEDKKLQADERKADKQNRTAIILAVISICGSVVLALIALFKK